MSESEASMGALSDPERDELISMRAEIDALKEAAAAPPPVAPSPQDVKPQQYWLHLANGEVIEAAGQMTQYQGIQVIGAYPVTEKEV